MADIPQGSPVKYKVDEGQGYLWKRGSYVRRKYKDLHVHKRVVASNGRVKTVKELKRTLIGHKIDPVDGEEIVVDKWCVRRL